MSELSRRELVKRVIKGTVYSAPVIRSLTVPRELAAQGPSPPVGGCRGGGQFTFNECREGGGGFCECCQSTIAECGELRGILGLFCALLCGASLRSSTQGTPTPGSKGNTGLPEPPWARPPGGGSPPRRRD